MNQDRKGCRGFSPRTMAARSPGILRPPGPVRYNSTVTTEITERNQAEFLEFLSRELTAIRADLNALAKVIAAIGELALAVPGLQALEVNPLWVSGDQVEALDVLVVADVTENGAG